MSKTAIGWAPSAQANCDELLDDTHETDTPPTVDMLRIHTRPTQLTWSAGTTSSSDAAQGTSTGVARRRTGKCLAQYNNKLTKRPKNGELTGHATRTCAHVSGLPTSARYHPNLSLRCLSMPSPLFLVGSALGGTPYTRERAPA